MFPKSSIDKKEKVKLENLNIQKLPAEQEGYEILAVEYYSFPVKEIEVEYTVLERKELNLIEKHILRAAAELSPAAEIKETAEILGLSENVVLDFSQKLAASGLLAENISRVLSITELGEKILLKTTEKIEKKKKLKLNYDIFSERYQAQLPFVGERDSNFIPVKLPYINWEEADGFKREKITRELIRDISLENNQIQQLKEITITAENLQPAAVILIYDVLKSELMFKVLSVEDGSILAEHQRLLNFELNPAFFNKDDAAEIRRENLFVEDFSYKFLSDLGLELITETEAKTENESYFNHDLAAKIKKEAEQNWAKKRGQNKSSKEKDESSDSKSDFFQAEYLTKEKIRPKYVELIEKSEQQILILSGWINDHTVDDVFIKRLQKAAQRGVLMLLGWGMNDNLEAEDRTKNEKMRKLLSRVKTPAGNQAVSLYWVGDQHQKEVIVDQKYHLLGSHNFLSYRGDHKRGYKLRHESAYFNSNPEGVSAAFANQTALFIEAMRKEFSNYIMDFNGTLPAVEALSSWLILNREKELLRLIKIEARKSERNQEAVIIYLEKFFKLLLEQEELNDKDHSEIKEAIAKLIEEDLKQKQKKLQQLLAK
ncbi:MAG: hypothetical protein ACOCRV_01095 [bacterium]